jgi:hypothetical protein
MALPRGAAIRIGPLVFWPSIRSPGSGARPSSEWPFVVKAPVVLPARTRLVLAVAPEAAGTAAFQHRGAFVDAIRFAACSERVRAWAYDGTVGRFTGFPFSIGLKQRSACVPMEVWLDGRDLPIRRIVPVGHAGC